MNATPFHRDKIKMLKEDIEAMLKKNDPQLGDIDFKNSSWIVLHRGKSLGGVVQYSNTGTGEKRNKRKMGTKIQVFRFAADQSEEGNESRLLDFLESEVVNSDRNCTEAYLMIPESMFNGSIWQRSKDWDSEVIEGNKRKVFYTAFKNSEATSSLKRRKIVLEPDFMIDKSSPVIWKTPDGSKDPPVCVAASSLGEHAGNGVFYIGENDLDEQKIVLIYSGTVRDKDEVRCKFYYKKTEEGIGGVILDGIRDTSKIKPIADQCLGSYGHNVCGSFVNHQPYPSCNLQSLFIPSLEVAERFKRYQDHPVIDTEGVLGTATGILVFITCKKVKPGEELFSDYGIHSEDFLGKGTYKYNEPTDDDEVFVAEPVLSEEESSPRGKRARKRNKAADSSTNSESESESESESASESASDSESENFKEDSSGDAGTSQGDGATGDDPEVSAADESQKSGAAKPAEDDSSQDDGDNDDGLRVDGVDGTGTDDAVHAASDLNDAASRSDDADNSGCETVQLSAPGSLL